MTPRPAGRTIGAALAVMAALAAAGCGGETGQPTASDRRAGPTEQVCPDSDGLSVVGDVPLKPARKGGPIVDRSLRATRLPSGDLCVIVATGHADLGADVVSTRLEIGQAGTNRTEETTGDDRLGPVLLSGRTCSILRATLRVTGAGEAEFAYRARLRVGHPCPARPAEPPGT